MAVLVKPALYVSANGIRKRTGVRETALLRLVAAGKIRVWMQPSCWPLYNVRDVEMHSKSLPPAPTGRPARNGKSSKHNASSN